MKIITTLFSIESIESLSSHADGFMIGHKNFGARLTRSFEISEINEAIKLTNIHNKELFIQANQMMDDKLIQRFKQFINQIDVDKVTGIIVADIGAIMLLKANGIAHKAIYNPETLLTNTYDFNFLHKENIYGGFVAKEITLLDIKQIAKNKKINVFMVGHGHLNMFYSKRQLVHNFMDFIDKEHVYHERQNLKIIEEQRKDEPYPIVEDQAGTHVFRSHVFNSLNHLKELEKLIDYLVIDTIFKDDQYAQRILPMYHQLKIDENQIESLKKDYQESWDEGFFYKKTIYKTKET